MEGRTIGIEKNYFNPIEVKLTREFPTTIKETCSA